MARPETPIDPRTGPLAAFAVELRQLRELAGLTYRELAQRAHCSHGALNEAAGGHRLPTWLVTEAFVKGCGGDPQRWEARWQAVAAEIGVDSSTATAPGNDGGAVAAPSDSSDVRGHLLSGGAPPLSSITSRDDFHLALRELRTRVGNPSLRDLSVSARKNGDHVLPRSTLADALAHTDRLPSLEIVEAFLSACDVPATEVDAWKSAWARVAYLLQRNSMPESARWQGGCPYRGLAAFTQDQAEVFHGRERMTTELLAQLADRVRGGVGMLVVTGPSGAGKSSLLRAGLLPALAKGKLGPGSQDWPHLVITPGSAPLDGLAVHLAQLAGVNSAEVRESLAEHPDTAHLNARQALLACAAQQAGSEPRVSPSRLVLVVDQFEELFTMVSDKAEREAFITSLCAMAGVGCNTAELPPAIVVLGLRADFFSDCTACAPLVEVMRSGMFVVGPMTEGELRSAITGPAEAAGLSVEAGLVDNVLAELRSPTNDGEFDPGALPLLSQAMLLTWEHREDTTLTRHAYAAGGGLRNGIQTSADAAYRNLTPAQQEAARMLFRRMVTFTDQGKPTRRQIQLNLCSSTDDDVNAALEEFTNKRLITRDKETAEIVHEVLVHTWKRLKSWIDQDREWLRLSRELEGAASAWEGNGQDPAFLYQGSRLEVAQESVNETDSTVPPSAQSFLDASMNHERRRTRKLRGLRNVVGLVVVVALLAGVTALYQYHYTAEFKLATADAFATKSQLLAVEHSDAATLLAVEASHLAPTPVTLGALLSAQSQYFAGQLVGHTDNINKVVFSPDGHTLATASVDGTTRLWDVVHHQPINPPLTSLGSVNDAEFSPDGHILATAATNGTAQLWDVASRRSMGTLPRDPDPSPSSSPGTILSAVTFSPDNRFLATASLGGTARLWDVASRQLLATLHGSDLIINVVFSPSRSILATTGTGGVVQLWNVADPQNPTQLQLGSLLSLADHTDRVSAVAFSRDGNTLAAAANGVVKLWKVEDPHHPNLMTTLTDENDAINAVVFSPDGHTLVTAKQNGIAQLWDVYDVHYRKPVGTLRGHYGAIRSVAFNQDGHTVATAGEDHITRLWDTNGPIRSSPNTSADVYAMEFSPDGHVLATLGGNGAFQLWDTISRNPIPMPTSDVVAFSGAGRLLATVDTNGTAQLWDTISRRSIASLAGQSKKVLLSSNGHILATTDGDDNMRLWDTTNPSHLVPLAPFLIGHISDVVAFSGAGRLLATVDTNGTAQLWDIANQHFIATLTNPAGIIKKMVFSPDGGSLVTASDDGSVQRWEAATGRLTTPVSITVQLRGRHSHPLALSPDGRILAATSSDDTATTLWDIDHDGEPIATLVGHTDRIHTAVFNQDRHFLATASDDGTVRLWDLDPGHVTNRLCQIIGTVSKEQWGKFMPKFPYRPTCH